MPGSARVLVASNRGPLSFREDAGELVPRPGGGGLIAGLAELRDLEATWICSALSDADRRAVHEAPGGRLDLAGHPADGAVRMLGIDATTFRRAYREVANRTLWFLHHMLFDAATAPVFDQRFRRQWAAYEDYNAAFADALAAEAAPGARVLVQDYHLTLTPRLLRIRRPDLKISWFAHTPWAPPAYFRILPENIGWALLDGLLAADAVGFHSARWRDAFAGCCADAGFEVVGPPEPAVRVGGHPVRLGVHPLGVDGDELRAWADRPEVAVRRRALAELVGDRALLLRVDRTEPAKNIVRGLAAYRELLRTHPEWRGRVVHVAFAYPSRHDLPEYRDYVALVRQLAREIDEEFATPDWTPLVVEVSDDHARSLAAYALADVLLVNPIRDGMNLVAQEGMVLSRRDAVLVLSGEAGAADVLPEALQVNPYDVGATAAALHRALAMPADERARRCAALAAAATRLPPRRWVAAQLAALG